MKVSRALGGILALASSGCLNGQISWAPIIQSYSPGNLPMGAQLVLTGPSTARSGACIVMTVSLVDGGGHAFTITADQPLAVTSSYSPPASSPNPHANPPPGKLYLDAACGNAVTYAANGCNGANGCVPASNLVVPAGQTSVTFSGRSFASGQIYLTAGINQASPGNLALSLNHAEPFANVSTVAGPLSPRGYNLSPASGAGVQLNDPQSLANDGSYLYIADTWNGVIRRMSLAAPNTVTLLAGQFYQYEAIDGSSAQASLGFVEGMAVNGSILYFADLNSLRAVDLTTGNVSTLAGSPYQPGHVDSADPSQARFVGIQDIATDGTYVYVAERLNVNGTRLGLIRRYNITTRAVDTMSLNQSAQPFNLWGPTSIAYASNTLYVADSQFGGFCSSNLRGINTVSGAVTDYFVGTCLQRIGVAGGSLYMTYGSAITSTGLPPTSPAPYNTITTPGDMDGTPATASFGGYLNGLSGLTGTVNGVAGTYLFVADTLHHSIRLINIGGSSVTTIAGQSGLLGLVNANGAAARFNGIDSVATLGGFVFVGEAENKVLRKINPGTGAVTAFYSMPDGVAWVAPVALASDGTNLFMLKNNEYIQKLDINASSTYNTPPFLNAAPLTNSYRGLAVTGGDLYVTDSTWNAVYRLNKNSPDQILGVIGATGIQGADSNGGAATARFNQPGAIAVTPNGNTLFVMDDGDRVLRMVDISVPSSPQVSDLAGGAPWGGSVDGIGSSAGFDSVGGLASDGTYVYVSEFNGSKIRQVEIATGIVLTLDPLDYPMDVDGAYPSVGAISSPFALFYDAVSSSLYLTNDYNVRVLH